MYPSHVEPITVYAGYLFFRQHSHAFFYEDQGLHSIRTTAYTSPKFRIPRLNQRRHIRFKEPVRSPIDEEDTPKLNLYMTIGLLTAVTVVSPQPLLHKLFNNLSR